MKPIITLLATLLMLYAIDLSCQWTSTNSVYPYPGGLENDPFVWTHFRAGNIIDCKKGLLIAHIKDNRPIISTIGPTNSWNTKAQNLTKDLEGDFALITHNKLLISDQYISQPLNISFYGINIKSDHKKTKSASIRSSGLKNREGFTDLPIYNKEGC